MAQIRSVLVKLIEETRIHPVSAATILQALNLAERYGYSHYDSLMISAALEAGCDILFSEDLHRGQVIEDRLTIVNPFVQ